MPSTSPRFTEHGCHLYWIRREETGEELTPEDFIEQEVYGDPMKKNHCQYCGEWKPIIGMFCLACVAGAVKS